MFFKIVERITSISLNILIHQNTQQIIYTQTNVLDLEN